MPMNDNVNHPAHYTDGKYEVIDFIEEYKLPFHLANTVKYICRAGKKDPEKTVEDLRKARWYLNRFITDIDNYDLYTHSLGFLLHDVGFFGENPETPCISASDFCEDKNLNVNLGDVIRGIATWCYKVYSRDEIKAYLRLCGCRDSLDAEIERLSGGMDNG